MGLVQSYLREEEGAEGAGELVQSYNRCLRELGKFRALHLTQAHRYIRAPALGTEGEGGRKEEGGGEEGDVPEGAKVGTGGSDFMVFLRRIHRVTLSHVVGTEAGGGGGGA